MSVVSAEDTRNTVVDNLLVAGNIDEVALAAADLVSLGPDVYDSTIEEYARRVAEEGRDRLIVDFAENLRDVSRVVIDHEVRAGKSARFASSVIIQNEAAREFHQDGDYCTEDLVVYGLDYHAKFTDKDIASRAAGLMAELRRKTGNVESRQGNEAKDFYLRLSVPESITTDTAKPSVEVVRDDVVRVNGSFVKLNKHQVFLLNVLMQSGGDPLAAIDFRERGFGVGLKPSTIGTRLSAEKSKLIQELNAAMPGLLIETGGRRDRQITITTTNVIDLRSNEVEVPQSVLMSKRRGRKPSGNNTQAEGGKFDDEYTEEKIDYSEIEDTIKLYFGEIGKHKLLTAEEEVELSTKVQAGLDAARQLERLSTHSSRSRELQRMVADGKSAREVMVVANLRLSVWIAKRYARNAQHLNLQDLIQEGNAGLMRAVDKFDPTLGYRFSTYATNWVRQGITRALAEQDKLVRTPVYVSEEIRVSFAIANRLQEELGRRPTNEEIAAASKGKLGVKEVARAFRASSIQPRSLDRELEISDNGLTMIEVLPDETGADSQLAELEAIASEAELDELLRRSDLTLREKYIVSLRYGAFVKHLQGTELDVKYGVIRYDDLIGDAVQYKGFTLEDLGNEFYLTRERIRQIEAKAVGRLTEVSREQFDTPEYASSVYVDFFCTHGRIPSRSELVQALRDSEDQATADRVEESQSVYRQLCIQAEQEMMWSMPVDPSLNVKAETTHSPHSIEGRIAELKDKILEGRGPGIYPVAYLNSALFGKELDGEEFKDFVVALRRAPGISYWKWGDYVVHGDTNPKSLIDEYSPRLEVMEDLANAVLNRIGNVYQTVSHQTILGAAKSVFGYLTAEEKEAYFQHIYEHNRVIPQEDGRFYLRSIDYIDPDDLSLEELAWVEMNPIGKAVRGEALSEGEIRQVMSAIRQSPEMHQAIDRAKRKADSRKRGKNFKKKGSRMQGKNHGKSVDIDKLIAEMNAKQ